MDWFNFKGTAIGKQNQHGALGKHKKNKIIFLNNKKSTTPLIYNKSLTLK